MKKYLCGLLYGVFICAALCLLPAPRAAFGQEGVGAVIAARKNAWAERGLAEEFLISKSPVFSGDVINTNPQGRLQILFQDKSALMMAPDSRITLTEYIYSENSAPSMKVSISKGLTQLISGKMVEGHPGAMRVSTPQAEIGIKGTIAAMEVDPLQRSENIYLLQLGRNSCADVKPLQGPVVAMCRAGTVVNIREGMASSPRDMTPGEFRRVSGALNLPGEYGALPESTASQASPGIMATVTGELQNASGYMPLLSMVNAGSITPSSGFAGSYAGPVGGTDMFNNTYDGYFTLGIADVGGKANISSFELSASSIPSGGAYFVNLKDSGSGNLGPVTSGGNFLFTVPGEINNAFPATGKIDGKVVGSQVDFDWETSSLPTDPQGRGSGSRTN